MRKRDLVLKGVISKRVQSCDSVGLWTFMGKKLIVKFDLKP